MTETTFAALDGGQVSVAAGAISDLASQVSGGVLTAQDPGYGEARTIWNGMIDKHPALIARCQSASDVAATVKFAAANGLLTAVRGGGHNVAGNAVCDGGLMIDLSPMQNIEFDNAGNVTVEPGCALGDLDAATAARGRVVPGGIVSTTGVAGLTLGGGFGWLTRKYGMTVDSLLSVDVVLANGSQVTASEQENSDLFWGVRGGGGNFGVVTSFKFKSYELASDIYCGLVVKPFAEARDYFKFHYDYLQQMPDEMSLFCVLRQAPPLPFLPESVHGQRVVVVAFAYFGDQAEGEKLIKPVRDFGSTLGEHIGMAPYAAWQSGFDGLNEPGFRNYWKSHNFAEVNSGLIDVILTALENQPSPHCEIFLPHLGGANNRVDPMATAYHHRQDPFLMNVHSRWEQPEDDARMIAWARKLFNDTQPYATGGVYVNFVSDEGEDRVRSAYPTATWNKLVELKTKYDPNNQFRLNQNIQPATATAAG